MAEIIIRHQGTEIRRLVLEDEPIVLGRDAAATISLNDKRISRDHALISPTGAGYVITDLSSRNGTFMRGRQIIQARLKHGDEITINTYTIEFIDEALPEMTSELDRILYANEPYEKAIPESGWKAVITGPGFNQEYELVQSDYLCGRSADCDWRLKDKHIAPKHLLIVKDRDRVMAINISEDLPLRINGFPAPHKTALAHNSVIELGGYTIRLNER